MPATRNQPMVSELPVFRLCVVCGDAHEEEEMSQCICGNFGCVKHICECPESIALMEGD